MNTMTDRNLIGQMDNGLLVSTGSEIIFADIRFSYVRLPPGAVLRTPHGRGNLIGRPSAA